MRVLVAKPVTLTTLTREAVDMPDLPTATVELLFALRSRRYLLSEAEDVASRRLGALGWATTSAVDGGWDLTPDGASLARSVRERMDAKAMTILEFLGVV